MPEFDQLGRVGYASKELAELLYVNPDLDLSNFEVVDPSQFNKSNKQLQTDFPVLQEFIELNHLSLEEYDSICQSKWKMPSEYIQLDIAKWVLDQCKNESELQRVGEELILYQDRDLFNLLRFLKYLVDTMRANKIIWGVGRGSSVASFVLYLIGIHRINSIQYQLPIEEFLK